MTTLAAGGSRMDSTAQPDELRRLSWGARPLALEGLANPGFQTG